MNKSNKKRMIWGIVWATLFIAVLYSPAGSPELYESTNVVYEQGVVFDPNMKIPQLEINKTNSEIYVSNSSSNLASEFSSAVTTAYTVNAYEAGNSYPSGDSKWHTPVTKSDNTAQSVALGLAAKSGSGTSSSGCFSTATNAVYQDANASNRQAASYDAPGQTTVDPGDGDPGTAIPIGNGYLLLWFFLAVYSIIKVLSLRTSLT